MARIRSIKPDAFRSSTLSSVPVSARWTFAGLWTYVDDAGRGIYNPRLIWSDLYPLDETTMPADVQRDLDDLLRVGAIELYEVDGKLYFHIPAWEKHQSASYRRGESHLPEPTSACRVVQESANAEITVIPAQTGTLHDSARGRMQKSAGREGKGDGREQGREVEVEGARAVARNADTHNQSPPVFVEFCDAYPGNVATKPALAAWTAAVKRTRGRPEVIIAGAFAYAAYIRDSGTELKFTRNAVKWLNEDGWLDKLQRIAPAPSKSTTDNRVGDAFALADQLRAQEEANEPPTMKAIGR